jgi:hypothetical protein
MSNLFTYSPATNPETLLVARVKVNGSAQHRPDYERPAGVLYGAASPGESLLQRPDQRRANLTDLKAEVTDVRERLPPLTTLPNPEMKPRHWTKLSEELRIGFQLDEDAMLKIRSSSRLGRP